MTPLRFYMLKFAYGILTKGSQDTEVHLGGYYNARLNRDTGNVIIFNDVPEDDITRHCSSIFQPYESIEMTIDDFKMVMKNYHQIEKVFPSMQNFQPCYMSHDNTSGQVLCFECQPNCSYSDFANLVHNVA